MNIVCEFNLTAVSPCSIFSYLKYWVENKDINQHALPLKVGRISTRVICVTYIIFGLKI